MSTIPTIKASNTYDLPSRGNTILNPSSADFFLIGTNSGDILKFNKSSEQFDSKKISEASVDILVQNTATSLIASSGTEIFHLRFDLSLIESFSLHEDTITGLAILNSSIFTGSDDSKVMSFDISTKASSVLYVHPSSVITLDLDPKHHLLASSCSESSLWIYDIKQGKVIHSLQCESKVWSIKFLPVKSMLITGDNDSYFIVRNLKNMEVVFKTQPHESRIKSIGVSSDSQFIATAGFDQIVNLFEVGDSKDQSKTFINVAKMQETGDWIRSVVFNGSQEIWITGDFEKLISYKLEKGKNSKVKAVEVERSNEPEVDIGENTEKSSVFSNLLLISVPTLLCLVIILLSYLLGDHIHSFKLFILIILISIEFLSLGIVIKNFEWARDTGDAVFGYYLFNIILVVSTSTSFILIIFIG